MSEDHRYSSLPVRGVHLDCRAQMLRFERIVEIFHDLARWGYNTVLFEYEDRFPYAGRLRRIVAEDALTRRQIRDLCKLARSLGLQIVPLIQCLGHLQYVLQHRPFSSLAEGSRRPRFPSTMCPSNPRSVRLFRQMARQVLDLHGDCRYFHMGGDEAALDPACPRCTRQGGEAGLSGLLVDHYLACAEYVRSQGPDPVIWCDMALRHPQGMDLLRGRVVIMDWDYWSGTEPTERVLRVWGVPPELWQSPAVWPPDHRNLFARYVFTDDGKGRPFAYTPFLRDRGFQVLVAPALRSAGDSFCVPRPLHIDNVIGAVRAAAEHHVLGVVITSWAVRRAPWPLTEYGLIAGSMTMADPRVCREAIDAAFAAEHFGVDDPGLAKIATLLGTPVAGLIDSRPRFCGSWPGPDYAQRAQLVRADAAAYGQALAVLRCNLQRAEALLAKARPRTARQRSRVRLWHWALQVLRHFARLGPQLLVNPGAHDVGELRQLRSAAGMLDSRTQALLSSIYTDRTMRDERQTRFGAQIDYLHAVIEAGG